MNEISSYEKQLLWKLASSKKAEKLREEHNTSKESSFQPKFYSNSNVKKFEGHARELTEASGQRHVDRQIKARKERDHIIEGNKISESRPESKTKHVPEMIEYDSDNVDDEEDESERGYLNAHLEHTSNDNSNISEGNNNANDTLSEDGSTVTEEPVVELLERERKEWQSEREKLIQCIHLQQLELTQRSLAAHERAVDIAKEFAKAIEMFEDRLVSVESSVQREILSIKSIAEAILIATTANNSNGSSNIHHNGHNGMNHLLNPSTPTPQSQLPAGNSGR